MAVDERLDRLPMISSVKPESNAVKIASTAGSTAAATYRQRGGDPRSA